MWRGFLFLSLFISVFGISTPAGADDTEPGDFPIDPYTAGGPGFYFDTAELRHAIRLDQELTFQQLLDEISSNGIVTIPDLIGALPDYMRNDNYVLMYRSRSLQSATENAPRVIVYTPTASLVLAFNGGESGSAGGKSVETVQFDQDTKQFVFHELVFDGRSAPQVSGPNPTKCVVCHQNISRTGMDLRPNWEPYSTWPGAFGSDGGLE